MLKISQLKRRNHAITLRFEGRLVGPWVEEARQACEPLVSAGRPLKVDLADVSFMDSNGVALLTSLRSRGVALLECSPFVQEQLKTAGDEPPPALKPSP